MHHNSLNLVEEGMDVYDSNGDKIGEVKMVYLGTTSDEAEAYTTESASVPDPDLYRDDSFVEDIAEVFAGEEMPEEVRERLLTNGYLHIEGGLFGNDQYAMGNQVAGVDDEGVHLNTTSEHLLG